MTNLASERIYFRLTYHPDFPTFATPPFDQHWWTIRKNDADRDPYKPFTTIQHYGPKTFIDDSLLAINPHQTATVTLLPRGRDHADQVFGYLDVSIPMTWTTTGALAPQSDQPVPVLLTALSMSHQTWPEYPEVTELAASIPLSTGQSLNEIMPQQTIEIALGLFDEAEGAPSDDPAEGQQRDYAAMFEDPQSASTLVTFLGLAGQSREGVEALNRLLQRGGHTVRLRKGR